MTQQQSKRMTKRQKAREHWAKLCDQIAKNAGLKSQKAIQLRAINRRVDKRKGRL